MKYFMLMTIALCGITGTLHAQRGGRGGGFNPGAGGARPNMQMNLPSPQFNQFNRGIQPMQRPPVSMGGMQGFNRPMPNFQQQQRPATLPSVPYNRPSVPYNRPTAGITPGSITRPTIPGTATTPYRATVQPPITSLPGVSRPTTPSNPWRNPNLQVTGGATTLPGTGGVTRPGTGSITRPGSGVDVGLDRPYRSTNPTIPSIGGGITRPATPPITRPNLPGTAQRPIVRPPTTRPIVNQPITINNNQINRSINTRPSWVNINRNQVNNIHNQWNHAIVNRPQMHNWMTNNPARYHYWNGWGNGIRNHWQYYHHHDNWFGHSWWNTHRPAFGGWHYYYWFPYYPYNYWWTVPTWGGLSSWFIWNAALANVWTQPVYYDYGIGGNVVYQNDMVYIGGQQVASRTEFAESAADLATVPPPESEEQAAQAEWMPLGTFAMSTGEKDTDPTRVVQLAVTKDGIIGGTLFNYQTNQSVTIQGKVDKETQRVAFRLGDRDNLIAETGMYNLTQDEVPVLVHFGTEKTENFLFVRLKNDGDLPK